MEKIFRKELRADSSVTDTPVTEEPDDCAPELSQKKGEKKWKTKENSQQPGRNFFSVWTYRSTI